MMTRASRDARRAYCWIPHRPGERSKGSDVECERAVCHAAEKSRAIAEDGEDAWGVIDFLQDEGLWVGAWEAAHRNAGTAAAQAPEGFEVMPVGTSALGFRDDV